MTEVLSHRYECQDCSEEAGLLRGHRQDGAQCPQCGSYAIERVRVGANQAVMKKRESTLQSDELISQKK